MMKLWTWTCGNEKVERLTCGNAGRKTNTSQVSIEKHNHTKTELFPLAEAMRKCVGVDNKAGKETQVIM